MLLGKSKVIEALASGAIYCDPSSHHIEAAHIDVTLGAYYWLPRVRNPSTFVLPDEDDPRDWYELCEATDYVLIPAGAHALCHTREYIGTTVPWLQPELHTRSTVARWGVPAHLSAGRGDPGYHSRWTLEVRNHWDRPIWLPVGGRIACVCFEEVEGNNDLYTDRYNRRSEDWTPECMLPRKGNW